MDPLNLPAVDGIPMCPSSAWQTRGMAQQVVSQDGNRADALNLRIEDLVSVDRGRPRNRSGSLTAIPQFSAAAWIM
jgi:hypothetical protein